MTFIVCVIIAIASHAAIWLESDVVRRQHMFLRTWLFAWSFVHAFALATSA